MEPEIGVGTEKAARKQFTDALKAGDLGREEMGLSLSNALLVCRRNKLSFIGSLAQEKDNFEHNNLMDIPRNLPKNVECRNWVKQLNDDDKNKLIEDTLTFLKQFGDEGKDIEEISASAVFFMLYACQEGEKLGILDRLKTITENSTSQNQSYVYLCRAFRIAAGDDEELKRTIIEIEDEDEENRGSGWVVISASSQQTTRDMVARSIREELEKGTGVQNAGRILGEIATFQPDLAIGFAPELMQARLAAIEPIKEIYGAWNFDAEIEVSNLYQNGAVPDDDIYKLAVLTEKTEVLETMKRAIEENRVPRSDQMMILRALCGVEDDNSLSELINRICANGRHDDETMENGLNIQDIGGALRRLNVLPGDENWKHFIERIPEFDNRDRWIMGLTFEVYVGNVQPGETRRDLVNSLENINIDLLKTRSTLALELAQERLLSGKIEDEKAALEIFAHIQTQKAENKRWRNVMLSVAKAHPTDMERLAEVGRALATRANECQDPEIINYLVDEFEKLVREGNDQEKLMIYAEVMTSVDARYAMRKMYEAIADERVDEKIVRKLVEAMAAKDVIDARIIEKEIDAKTLVAIREMVRSDIRVTKEVLDLVKSGKSVEEIRLLYSESLKKPWKERLQDNLAMSLEYSFGEQNAEYGNTFGYGSFREIIEGARTVKDTGNAEIGIKINKCWEGKAQGSPALIDGYRNVYQLGIPDKEIILTGDDNNLERVQKRISEQVAFFGNRTKPLVLTDQMLGRVEGLVKKLGKNGIDASETMTEAKKMVENVDNSDGQHIANFGDIYSGLYDMYAKLFNMAKEKGILDTNIMAKEQLMQMDEAKYTAEIITGQELSLVQRISKLKEKTDLAKKRAVKLGLESGGWWEVVGDLSGALDKLEQSSLSRQAEIGSQKESDSYIIRFLSPTKGLYSFCRVGDARESCIANNGVNRWTLAGYVQNEGTRGFIVIDGKTHRAVGHSVTHLTESPDGLGVISNGIYLENGISHEVGDAVAEFIDEWREQSGFTETEMARSGFSDMVPKGFEIREKQFRVLQGVRVNQNLYGGVNERNMYYDGDLPVDEQKVASILVKTGN